MDAYLGDAVLRNALLFCIPILLAAFGELLIERAGILNLAIEGMVSLGASATFVVAYASQAPTTVAVVAGAVASAAIGAALAHLTVDRNLDHATVGLALLVFSLGAASLLYRLVIGVQTTPARVETLTTLKPFLTQIPVIGPILFRQPWPVWIVLLGIVPMWFLLHRTTIGLRLRATGENPRSMDSLGVPVRRIRWSAVLAGSVLIGLAGATYPLILSGGWSEGTIGGRGWLALMVVILARWRVGLLLPAAFLFAYLDAVSFSLAIATHAVPTQVIQMLPFVLAIVVIGSSYGRARAPGSLAKRYDREARV